MIQSAWFQYDSIFFCVSNIVSYIDNCMNVDNCLNVCIHLSDGSKFCEYVLTKKPFKTSSSTSLSL